MEDVLQWILTLKNKNNEINFKKIAFNWNCIGSFHLFGYYLEYITRESTDTLELQRRVDKWEINIH
jgi:hypothetical protein